ncbi:hypothetical protein [Desulfatirhabdium butyrativorans]|uniref:hypothetical protein n=1 Tax=Desulfatirhabdium butyrativorans TaxID=340467 RepID=UPI0004169A2D|nr:hypothetical protein [Desulfatirhabdium butyrativorans]
MVWSSVDREKLRPTTKYNDVFFRDPHDRYGVYESAGIVDRIVLDVLAAKIDTFSGVRPGWLFRCKALLLGCHWSALPVPLPELAH